VLKPKFRDVSLATKLRKDLYVEVLAVIA